MGESYTEYSSIASVDMQMKIMPNFLMNFMMKAGGPVVLGKVKKLVKKVRESDYYKEKMKEKGDFYDEADRIIQ